MKQLSICSIHSGMLLRSIFLASFSVLLLTATLHAFEPVDSLQPIEMKRVGSKYQYLQNDEPLWIGGKMYSVLKQYPQSRQPAEKSHARRVGYLFFGLPAAVCSPIAGYCIGSGELRSGVIFSAITISCLIPAIALLKSSNRHLADAVRNYNQRFDTDELGDQTGYRDPSTEPLFSFRWSFPF